MYPYIHLSLSLYIYIYKYACMYMSPRLGPRRGERPAPEDLRPSGTRKLATRMDIYEHMLSLLLLL